MRKIITLLIVLYCIGIQISNAQILSKDSLYNEFREFVQILEDTHPDPYSEFGGKVEFYKTTKIIEEQLKSSKHTLLEYQNILRTFMARLHDGHSYIINHRISTYKNYIPFRVRTIPDSMILTTLPNNNAIYIGSKLISVGGIDLVELCEKVTQILPSENIYGAYKNLEYIFATSYSLQDLFPDIVEKDSILIEVLTSNNEIVSLVLELTDQRDWYTKINPIKSQKIEFLKKDYLYFSAIDNQSMYFRMASVMAQENFMEIQRQKWSSLEQQLKNFYQYTLKRDMPEDIDDAIVTLPNLASIFRTMLEKMKNESMTNLIIDLRGNTGGWTPIVMPTLYMLYGDEYLNADMNIEYQQKVSPLLLSKKGVTLEEFNQVNNSEYHYGDFILSKSFDENTSISDKHKEFIQSILGNGVEYIKDLDGEPVFSPKNIYVLTDEKTFSAAFHFAFFLWKMGAVIVGVPSSQSPNSYMEVTEFELPYTKTKGSISNSVQYYLPINDKRSKIFYPDIMLQYQDYIEHSYDKNAELLWLLNYIICPLLSYNNFNIWDSRDVNRCFFESYSK